MTFLEMEQTTWYDAYKERVMRDERNMKHDALAFASIFNAVAASVQRTINSLMQTNQGRLPQSSLSMGGSAS